ncbi:hypothetical protein JOB18_018588 [Solea senegalensis]|uniref:Uncharacterized protein n=1 Tax=Solea senegalensis TaxID=28829 RepID=A0AAV6QEN5_SOLSE|nr:hypothetical protein JOB18_018588 [Solea senegalensis]
MATQRNRAEPTRWAPLGRECVVLMGVLSDAIAEIGSLRSLWMLQPVEQRQVNVATEVLVEQQEAEGDQNMENLKKKLVMENDNLKIKTEESKKKSSGTSEEPSEEPSPAKPSAPADTDQMEKTIFRQELMVKKEKTKNGGEKEAPGCDNLRLKFAVVDSAAVRKLRYSCAFNHSGKSADVSCCSPTVQA